MAIAANTGKKAYLWLIEVNSATGQPTGRKKLNISTDPDYIAPVNNLGMCPLSIITWKGVEPYCVQEIPGYNNTGYQGFLKRERLINGMSDGYIENNIEDSNYIAPVLNEGECPIPN